MTGVREGEVTAVIRCEDVTVSTDPHRSSARNRKWGKVTDICPVRQGVELTIEAGIEISALVTAESVGKLGIDVGTEVFASFKATAVKILEG